MRFSGALWDFAQGYAQLRQGSADFARVYLARVTEDGRDIEGARSARTARNISSASSPAFSRVRFIAAAAIWATRSRSFERAVELEDDLAYDEPEPLPFSARHWLGAALLEAKRYADAERVYREELEDHPHNGWSLFGLQKALAARGITSPEVEADFAASWSRSDAWIQASRY